MVFAVFASNENNNNEKKNKFTNGRFTLFSFRVFNFTSIQLKNHLITWNLLATIK